ncbi:MAG TPA: methyltransferase domain-containing protein [Anaerolineales bacterium]|nr:methyltransferase domain-containing protein [Anaerolineales bacterium]
MSKRTNQTYLRTEQYKDSSNLNARAQLHARFHTNPYNWFLWVFDQFQLPPQASLLELGCGPGGLWFDNLGRIPPGWKITLSDFSPGMVEESQRKLGASGPFDFRVVDAQQIPFEDSSLDAVIANHMLYHVPDRPKALAEIQRVLKPGGHLYAATNGQNNLHEIHELMLEIDPDLEHRARQTFGVSEFTLENGTAQLAPYFSSVVIRPYPDDLVVTEAEPLIAYILSMTTNAEVMANLSPADQQEKINGTRRLVEDKIQKTGAIHISKSVGLFVATKG